MSKLGFIFMILLKCTLGEAADPCQKILVRGPWSADKNIRFANLLIHAGIDFKPGDRVVIRSELAQKTFAEDLSRLLTLKGAAEVRLFFYPNHAMMKKAIDQGISPESFQEEHLSSDEVQNLIDQKFSSIRLMGANEQGTPKGYDPKVFSQYGQKVNHALLPYLRFASSDSVPWTLVEMPTREQAKMVFPELVPKKAFKNFRKMVSNVFLLQHEDPLSLWIENASRLESRAKKLNELQLKRLHYQAEGTDLTVELHSQAVWKGGRHFVSQGRKFIANFPGFENFVTPKYRSTEGVVRVQRPVEVLGSLVKGAWFKFSAGEVVDYGAEEGREILTLFFNEDVRNRFLGEVALVDDDSPVLLQKRLFYSIVFDENALSHIALGRGYSHTFQPPYPVTEDDFEKLQMNSNQVKGHVDFMIGSADMKITAETYTGQTVELVRNGKLVFQQKQ